MYEVMDRYSDFDKPLQITEITIPAYSNEPEDEAIQAEILKNLYSIWFSHPNMEAIVYWNLAEGYLGPIADMAVGENRFYGGFTRFDFSKKPAYDVLYDLIHKQWHTCVQAETGNTNEMQFRGFYGNYDLEITVNGKTVHKNISTDKKRNNHFMIVL